MVGRKIFKYEIAELLGTGRLGPVYRARQVELERDVAIRPLPQSVVENPAGLERVLHDLKAAMNLDHENICRIFDILRVDAEWFVAVELLEGELLPAWFVPQTPNVSFGPWATEPPLSFPEYFSLARNIVRAVEAAHAAGVVHGRLKPSNLMMLYHGEFKIMDFGFAGIRKSAASNNPGLGDKAERHRLAGWAAYLSPEQIRGEPGDERSDIFSLGAMFYELATGLPPFVGKSSDAAIASALQDEPRGPLDQTPSLPVRLGCGIWKALQKEPRARYQKVSELRRDIDHVLHEANDWRRGPIVG